MNKIVLIVILSAGGLLLIVSTLINKSEPDSIVTKTGVEETTQIQLVLPENMPTNVPMYPESVIEKIQESEQGEEQNITLSLAAPASLADVNTWYRGALKENGWNIISEQNVGGYILFKSENGNITTFMQAANRSENGDTLITQRIRIR